MIRGSPASSAWVTGSGTLPPSLVRAFLQIVAFPLAYDAPQVLLAQDQELVQAASGYSHIAPRPNPLPSRGLPLSGSSAWG
jgi:hypothetical protein